VEIPPEEVPALQKQIIRKCNLEGKPVIIATQMLESMIREPSPTRAETSDVANAVFDGADAVMLSGETSVGAHPLETVRVMGRIIAAVEKQPVDRRRIFERAFGNVADRHDALARAACVLAEQLGAAAIVAVTHSGRTARVLARYRPAQPIVAITDEERTLRALSLVWGIRGFVLGEVQKDSDAALQRIQERLVEEGYARPGDDLVLLAGQPLFAEVSTNLVKVERVG
jgi:pyruvate kinase